LMCGANIDSLSYSKLIDRGNKYMNSSKNRF
jgi:hypothetical protein